MLFVRRHFVVDQNAVRRPIQVFELPVLQRPEKRAQPEQAQQQGRRDQVEQPGHGAVRLPRSARRIALSVTQATMPTLPPQRSKA